MAINYHEQQRQVQIYDYLVYVCGVEVSNYTRSIDVICTDRSAPGSATITFANPFDQWVVTQQNLKGGWRLSKDKYSEGPKSLIYYKKKALAQNLQIKRQQPNQSSNFGGSINAQAANLQDELNNSQPNKTQSEDFLQRYAFGPGSCIFSKLDTVKIFVRNPYDDPDTTDKWIPFFTGTVDSKPLITNFITGESTVTINCFDIRSAMQGMRISVNPYKNDVLANGSTANQGGIVASGNNVVSFSSNSVGFFKDYYPTVNSTSNPGLSNIFAGKTFVDAVSMVITGQIGWVNQGGQGQREGDGVGSFKPGKVYRYTNPKQSKQAEKNIPVNDLSNWDKLCLFGAKQDFWTFAECRAAGENSFYDGTAHPFTGSLHWLLPSEKLMTSSMIESTFEGVKDIMGSPDWTDRYSLLTQMSSQVDYQFTVTGTGDIIFEFPMYDFKPENFSQHPGVYTTEMHVKSENISDEGGDVVSGLECVSISSQLANRQVQQSLNQTAAQLNVPDWRVIVFSNVLASKYGARVQSVSFNGVVSEEAMKKLAVIEFQKRLAEANKLSLDMVFRPYLRPNRPFLYAERNRIRLGKTTTISYHMAAFQEPTMSLGLGCVRLPLFNKNTGQTTFQHITGAEAMALSYNEILEEPDRFDGNGDRAIVVQTVNTPKADGVTTEASGPGAATSK